jgi:DNA helicase-2/ATP-dependent DNA helicase PcrA
VVRRAEAKAADVTTIGEPEAILADLNQEQRRAAQAVTGPVVILAGAGTGKTRVISYRVAYAVASGAVDERQVLVVSFTTKAAGEMAERLRKLGLRRAKASTLHAAALDQLRYFWPQKRSAELPTLVKSKVPVIVPLARALPGHYRFTAVKDLADEIEWAKNRRIVPANYARRAAEADRKPPIPIDVMSRLYNDYERTKVRSGRLDFEDLLEEAVRLYETDAAAADLVRRRYAWFSVDEYQDTNPLQQALVDAWLGDRRDIGVVGDPNQTIYSFTGATPRFLLEFRERFPDAETISLVRNYRSTPQVLALANRLVRATSGPQLTSTSSDGPEPQIERYMDESSELAALTRGIRELLTNGTPAVEIAVLTRTNYQLEPIASHLRGQGVPFRFSGTPFFRSAEVRAAIRAIAVPAPADSDLPTLAIDRWRSLGYAPEEGRDDPDAAERQQTFVTLLAIVRRFAAEHPGASARDVLSEFDRLAAVEADERADGVTLSTIHGAKGAEWEAVFTPMLEEGSLPIYHALKNGTGVDEERRLLYVALTRAKRHLSLSWAAARTTPKGKIAKQHPSRFLAELRPPLPKPTAKHMTAGANRSDVIPGARVRHPKHGVGTVRSVSGWYAAVSFPRGKIANVDIRSLTVLGEALAKPERRRRSELFDPSGTASSDGRELRTFTRLAEWRRDRARRDRVPAFVIAHDATLRAIAAARPVDETALAAIAGIGPSKVERYGAEICEVIRSS